MKANTKVMSPIVMAVVAVAVLAGFGDTCTDDELRQDVREFLTTRVCGNYGKRILVDEIRFDGNTNRLANILVEFAQTNDEWVASKAVRQLGEYGTPAQLPFLYSCATNPVLGHLAVRAMLNIEGVTSNSVLVAGEYLSLTNVNNVDYERITICADLIKWSKLSGIDEFCRSNAFEVAHCFAVGADCNYYLLDKRIIVDDPSYRYSKRRLAYLRDAIVHAVQWEFQLNYVTNAINELVAYPEANLPE